MFGRAVRGFGLLFGGSVCIIGGGVATIYGLVLLYFSTPGSRSPMEVLAPLNEWVLTVLTSEVTAAVALVGIAGFAWEVRENGLLETDDRLRAERAREMRRELAEERPAWDPPEEDREDESVYQQLVEDESSGLIVVDDMLVSEDPVQVRGVVGNTASTAREEVRVRVRFVDGAGGTVGSAVATRKRLSPGERWEFEVFQREVEDVAEYRIAPPRAESDRET